ncbi:MAG: hypothetical protein Q9165_006253 [Trypethelium subeluteriae]
MIREGQLLVRSSLILDRRPRELGQLFEDRFEVTRLKRRNFWCHRFEDQRQRRQRSASLDSASRQQQQQRDRDGLAEDQAAPSDQPRATRPRSNSAYESREPHPALRISRRTASAVLYALEEALRQPKPFTPDWIEENAQMSDLVGGGNGRAGNGGSRAASGPTPVERPPELRTPRDIMNRRQQRDAERRRAELDAAARVDEQRRAQEVEARRISAERRAVANEQAPRTSGGARRTSAAGEGRGPVEAPGSTAGGGHSQPGSAREGERRTAASGSQVAQSAGGQQRSAPAQQPAQSATYPGGRPRGTSVSQDQPRPAAPSTRSGTQRATQGPSQMRPTPATGDQPSASQPPAQTTSGAEGGQLQTRSTTNSFPHAFQRWEDLSSHWEGLTSYWIRRLDTNTEELRREPLAQQMSRQITDLSAAGANLFHAVVELQRLRASSERKFQRWFFETRAEQEKLNEEKAQLERQLRDERKIREEGGGMMEEARKERRTAERMVAEMRRELQISKEEARRAWEELGRREQEERERTLSLREGQPTLVGGVQVVPMAAGMASRQGSMRERPGTSGGYQSEVAGPSVSGSQAGGDQGQYIYEGSQSPTDTDPFTESGQQQTSQPYSQSYHYPQIPASLASATPTAVPTTSGPSQPGAEALRQAHQQAAREDPATAAAQAFYRHQQPEETYLHYQHAPPAAPAAPPSGATMPPPPPAPSASRTSTRSGGHQPYDQGSYVPSSVDDAFSSEGGDYEDYEMDEHGNLLRDEHGHPILAPRRSRSAPRRSIGERLEEEDEEDEGDDDFDVHEEVERERELARRYGSAPTSGLPAGAGAGAAGYAGAQRPPPAPSSGAATQGYAGGLGPPDYSGTGYGSGWEGMPRHHHPTRLSDVLEEDERSRTSPSRASGTSRPY